MYILIETDELDLVSGSLYNTRREAKGDNFNGYNVSDLLTKKILLYR